MKFHEPKTAKGHIALGINIILYASDNGRNSWYLNGEKVPLDKIAVVLKYKSALQLRNAIKKYGVVSLFKHGLDYLRSEPNC